jgi:GNAT superfamily N-acetyltransferase
MSVTVRPAAFIDRHPLERLCAALLEEHQARFPDAYPWLPPGRAAALYAEEWTQRLGRSDPACMIWLAADHVQPVGFIVAEATTRSVGQPRQVAFAEWWYVAPDLRGRGVGRALEHALVDDCRRLGLSHVECQSVPSDVQWARRGWQKTVVRYCRSVEAFAGDLAIAERGHEAEEPIA